MDAGAERRGNKVGRVRSEMPEIDMIATELIERDPTQPRVSFDQDALDELAKSIETNGLLQPISLRKFNGGFQIVAGERRFRAMLALEWKTVPAIIHDLADNEYRKFQLIENIVREDLNPIEYARAMQQMVDEGMSKDEIGDAIGKTGGDVKWHLSILGCSDQAQHLIAIGQVSSWVGWHLARLSQNGQLRALRSFQMNKYTAMEMVALCERILAEENQTEMFEPAELTDPEKVQGDRFLRDFNSLSAAFVRLEKLELSKPGTVATIMPGQYVEQYIEQVKIMGKKLRWLEKQLARVKAMKGDVT